MAAIGNGAAFRRGRDFAAWVGVVPRQYSTGGKQKLFGISKRGNIYLRRMLIQGARAVLLRVKYDTGTQEIPMQVMNERYARRFEFGTHRRGLRSR